jgi:hypothetical protein
MPEAIGTEVVFSCTLIKWFTAGRAERCPNQPDILQACLAVRNILAPFQSSTAGKTGQGEKGVPCCLKKFFNPQPEFFSKNIAHSIQDIETFINKCLARVAP